MNKQKDNQKEILELKKLYLIQFEKFETKVYFAWLTILFGLFLAWLYGRVDGWFVIIAALFTCILDIVLICWRKKAFNRVIKEIQNEDLGEIE